LLMYFGVSKLAGSGSIPPFIMTGADRDRCI